MNENQNNKNRDKPHTFLKIPYEWFYDLEAGKWTYEEKELLEHLWAKADVNTGKVVVNYTILSEQLKERFKMYADIPNKITKLMLSLKNQQKLWFEEHRGSSRPVEVELHKYPLLGSGYTDISYRFQQNFGITSQESIPKKPQSPAELPNDEQNPKEPVNIDDELKNEALEKNPAEPPAPIQTERLKTDTQIDVWIQNYGNSIKGLLKDYGEQQLKDAVLILESKIDRGLPIRNSPAYLAKLCYSKAKWEDTDEAREQAKDEEHIKKMNEKSKKILAEANKKRTPEEQMQIKEELARIRNNSPFLRNKNS